MHKAIRAAVLICLTPLMTLAQATQPASQTAVPVHSVALFSSGVGYFEHYGTVHGNTSTELRFKTAQINDILKSLVLQDMDNGRVSTITYPSQDPLAKTLRSFQIDITNNPSLADLLNQLRGAKVHGKSQAEEFAGTVLGVEQKQKPVGDRGSVTVYVLNLLSGSTIRSFELDSVGSLSLDDPQLQDELNKALTALTQARDQDKKPVTINFTGDGDRRVRIGYVVETPVWKTSYRLMMDDKDGKLQGWAIVENQTDSDWNNVQLSLISGRPISFVMDLYQPLYASRPTVVQQLFAGLRPRVYDAGISPAQEPVAFAQSQIVNGIPPGGGGFGGAGGGGRGGGRGGRGAAPAASPPMAARLQAGEMSDESFNQPLDAASSIQSLASAAKIGELFQYTVGNVTLPRQKSAMLPIITDNIDIERLSIYNAGVLPRNPLNGARVHNSTNKHLLQGPVTVLDGGTYAGDAQIDNMPPGQERLLSYGVDLQMVVDNSKNAQTNSVLSGKLTKGVLEVTRKLTIAQDYTADNKGDTDRTLIIEHPIRFGWTLVGDKPIETTDTLYRFKGTVPAKKTTRLTVHEEMVQTDQISLLPTSIDQLLIYSKTGEIAKPVRDALEKAVALKRAMADTQSQIDDRTKQVNDITTEQARIRDNMRTVQNNNNNQYYQRLLTKLNEQESQIEKLQTERDDLTKKLDGQRKELDDYLANLNIG